MAMEISFDFDAVLYGLGQNKIAIDETTTKVAKQNKK